MTLEASRGDLPRPRRVQNHARTKIRVVSTLIIGVQIRDGLGLSTSTAALWRRTLPPLPDGSRFVRVQAQKEDAAAFEKEKESLNKEISDNDDGGEEEPKRNNGLRRLAQLSLEDYKWRTSLFKSRQADRSMEESLARIVGDEAAYVRPMDASDKKIGPIGRAEKIAVDWLEKVIYEEGRRAEKIVNSKGSLVRPKDAASSDGQLGPLGFMEKQFVDFVYKIRTAEKERARTNTLRPKDLDETLRGPLGEAELRAVSALREILDSERLRMMQSRARGGEVVRPIDVPGFLGEFEMAVLDVVKAERQRQQDRESSGKLLVRPMDSSRRGPLGDLERRAVEAVKTLTKEEKERLRNIQLVLDRNRPMEQEEPSALGIFEALVVVLVRSAGFFIGFLASLAKNAADVDPDESRRK